MSMKKGFKRRDFLKNTALGVVGAGIVSKGTPLTAEEKPHVKSVTTITTKQQALPADQRSAESDQVQEERQGGFAGRMMKKLKGKIKAKSQDKQEQQGGEQKMTVSSELKFYKGGVDVALSPRCVEAHAKKMKER